MMEYFLSQFLDRFCDTMVVLVIFCYAVIWVIKSDDE